MPSALKLFKNISLLKINDFTSGKLIKRFYEIADILLNKSILQTNIFHYRISEIEFYIKSGNHQDPFTHCHPEQLSFGSCCFHRTSRRLKSSYKGGKYQGLDLTLGDGENFAGVLIRRICPVTSDGHIDGPSLVVDQILKDYQVDSISTLISHYQDPVQLLYQDKLESKPIYMGPRVGLKLKSNQVTEENIHYFFKPFRCLTDPQKTNKDKNRLFLNQSYNIEHVASDFKISKIKAQKYIHWYQQGKNLDLFFCMKANANSVQKQCELLGSYNGFTESSFKPSKDNL